MEIWLTILGLCVLGQYIGCWILNDQVRELRKTVRELEIIINKKVTGNGKE